ncbi:hypothetical protein D3C87_1728340 [compost metagenome]
MRLSLVIGTGASSTAFISTPLGPSENLVASVTSSRAAPPASSTAISAAFLPSSRASFQTDTVCVPSAMRFSAAWSPSCPDTGTDPARPWALSAAMAPPAVPSFEATTASTSLLLAVRNCSMFAWATSGFQLSV